MMYNRGSFRGHGDHGEVKGDGMDAIKEKIEKLLVVGSELDFELEKLFGRLEELDTRREVVTSQIGLFGLRRAEVALQLEELNNQLKAREELAEEFEREFDREVERERGHRTEDAYYGRLNHSYYAWKRADKKERRGCDASRKRHRKQVREACRKQAREERATYETLDDLIFSLMEDDE